MKRRGFTLIELIVVVIVIGILATVAVPQYLSATERAKSAKARHALGLVSQAEKLYRADISTYVTAAGATINAQGTAAAPTIADYVELADVQTDCTRTGGDWCIAVGNVSTTTFTATATRRSGSDTGTITLDQDGAWGGTRLRRNGGEA